MKQKTLYLMCGVPGSGKTFWAKYFCNNAVHVSRDVIRFSIVKPDEEYFSHEKEVFRTFVKSIVELMNDGYDVIADATHLNQFSRRKLTQAIDMYMTQYEIIYIAFNVSADTCVTRNANRTGRANVPENVIRNMCRDYRAPSLEEDERVIEVIEVGE